MPEKVKLPEGMDKEKLQTAFESFQRKFENLKDPDMREGAISLLTQEIVEKFEYWLPPAFNEEAQFEVDGELSQLLNQIVSYLLGKD